MTFPGPMTVTAEVVSVAGLIASLKVRGTL